MTAVRRIGLFISRRIRPQRAEPRKREIRECSCDFYFGGAAGVHDVAPGGDDVPGGHGVHAAAPEPEKDPAAHGRHPVAPAAAKLPPGHAMHAPFAPAMVPAGQGSAARTSCAPTRSTPATTAAHSAIPATLSMDWPRMTSGTLPQFSASHCDLTHHWNPRGFSARRKVTRPSCSVWVTVHLCWVPGSFGILITLGPGFTPVVMMMPIS